MLILEDLDLRIKHPQKFLLITQGDSTMKDLYQFNLSVLIEKNRYNNEKKLNTEIEKMFAKNHLLKEIQLVQFKKTK